MKQKSYTPKQAAEILGIKKRRVNKKIEQKHFPNTYWCECGLAQLIPLSDIKKNKKIIRDE